MLKIVIIDYGIGNTRSVVNAFTKLGVKAVLSREKSDILNADGVILPGVGAFSQAMKNLRDYELDKTIQEYARTNKPLLGICLGMQILFDESHEFTVTKGLGIIPGNVVKLPDFENIKLPHINWTRVIQKSTSWEKTPLSTTKVNNSVYFIHSYMVVPVHRENILATSLYAQHEFCSVVKKGNIYGCQFHPEKSAVQGLEILDNFINICKEYVDGR